jgi:hypothetical protein
MTAWGVGRVGRYRLHDRWLSCFFPPPLCAEIGGGIIFIFIFRVIADFVCMCRSYQDRIAFFLFETVMYIHRSTIQQFRVTQM